MSTNYGVTLAPSSAPSSPWYGIAVSSSAQYAFALNQINAYVSSNFGSTWTIATGTLGGSSAVYASISCDSTGQYVYAVTTAYKEIDYSSNYGSSFGYSATGKHSLLLKLNLLLILT